MARTASVPNPPQATIVVIVPKEDEFVETARAFGIAKSAIETLDEAGEIEYFRTTENDQEVAVLCMDRQGNDGSQAFTVSMLRQFEPTLVCMTGTALGNPSYASVGAVFAGREVLNFTQIRQTEQGPVYQQVTPVKAHKPVMRDLRDHLDDGDAISALKHEIGQRAQDLHVEVDVERYSFNSEPIGSGNEYFRTTADQVDAALWQRYPNVRAYDMESWGLISAAEPNDVDWLIVRGVSDFGSSENMADEHRRLAAYASAALLRSFLGSDRERSLHRSSARRIDLEELPPSQFYAASSQSTSTFQERVGRDLGLELGTDVLDRALTPKDLVEVLVKAGGSRDDTELLLPVVHEEYFRDKYIGYRYRDDDGHALDSRALVPDWARSIRDALSEAGLSTLVQKSIVDVGCGNGAELPRLFEDAAQASELVLVDISPDMVDVAAQRLATDNVRAIGTNASDLSGIDTGSMDAYVSLRAYQSRLFDIEAAFREAYRVTRIHGVIAISISNGYASEITDSLGRMREVVIPGLKASGMDRSVSHNAPYELADRLRKLFLKFAITPRLHDLAHGELLVCGQVGTSYAPGYSGA